MYFPEQSLRWNFMFDAIKWNNACNRKLSVMRHILNIIGDKCLIVWRMPFDLIGVNETEIRQEQ